MQPMNRMETVTSPSLTLSGLVRVIHAVACRYNYYSKRPPTSPNIASELLVHKLSMHSDDARFDCSLMPPLCASIPCAGHSFY